MSKFLDEQLQRDPLPSLRHESLTGCGAPGCVKGRAIHEHHFDAARDAHAEDVPLVRKLRLWGTCPACNGTGLPQRTT